MQLIKIFFVVDICRVIMATTAATVVIVAIVRNVVCYLPNAATYGHL